MPAASRRAKACRLLAAIIIRNQRGRRRRSSYASVLHRMSRGCAAGLRSAQCIAHSAPAEHGLRANERFFRRAGGIDLRPFYAAEVKFFLLAGESRVSVGCIVRTVTDAGQTR